MDYLTELLESLSGWTVEGAAEKIHGYTGAKLYGLSLVKNGERKIVWFWQDYEMNAPGSFRIQNA